jgi:hypothetical protein
MVLATDEPHPASGLLIGLAGPFRVRFPGRKQVLTHLGDSLRASGLTKQADRQT